MIEFAELVLAAGLGAGITGVSVWFLFFRSAAEARKQQVKAFETVLTIKDAEIERLTRLSVAPVAADVEASIKLINQYASDNRTLAQELEEYKAKSTRPQTEKALFLEGLSFGLREGYASFAVVFRKWLPSAFCSLPPMAEALRDLTETMQGLMDEARAADAGKVPEPRFLLDLLQISTK